MNTAKKGEIMNILFNITDEITFKGGSLFFLPLELNKRGFFGCHLGSGFEKKNLYFKVRLKLSYVIAENYINFFL